MLLTRKLVKCSSEAVFAALVFVVAIAASGCVHHPHHRGRAVSIHAPGPPPHAPAHGYRHKHRDPGVELVFDGGLGVYAVMGLPGHYWHADRYVRWASGSWHASARLDGAWVVIAGDEVPKKLKAKHTGRAKKKHHRHSGPAKHRR